MERHLSAIDMTEECPAALRYAELNPVRAGLVTAPELWPWSSAAAHCGLASPDPML